MTDFFPDVHIDRFNGDWFYISSTAKRHIKEKQIRKDWIEAVLATCPRYPCGFPTRYGYHFIPGGVLTFEIDGEQVGLTINVTWPIGRDGTATWSRDDEDDYPVLHSLIVYPKRENEG